MSPMLLVALRFRETWLLSLSLLWACREAPPTPSAASASLRAASPAPGSGPEPSASAVPHLTVPSSGATVAASAAAVDYPPIAKSLAGDCNDPRALLAVRKEYDRSARTWLQQALLAHPEFVVVSEPPSSPGQVQIYETIYGVKNFSRSYPGQPRFSEALIARCADVVECNRLAAMVHAVSPRDGAAVLCGEPPGVTGGFSLVKELSPERMVIPESIRLPGAACARVHACAARERDLPAAAPDCSKLSQPALVTCAQVPRCAEVVKCAAGAKG